MAYRGEVTNLVRTFTKYGPMMKRYILGVPRRGEARITLTRYVPMKPIFSKLRELMS
jgi:hypothetical protein